MKTLRKIEPRPPEHSAPQTLLLVPVNQLGSPNMLQRVRVVPNKPTLVFQPLRTSSSLQSLQSIRGSSSSLTSTLSSPFSSVPPSPSSQISPRQGSIHFDHRHHEALPSTSSPSVDVWCPSFPQRRDILKRKIEQRPSRQKLVTQHILLSASSADPLIQQRAQLLKKQGIVTNLNKKLKQRPGPLELVTRKILQADAELEQAIQEGRLLFKPTGAEDDFHTSADFHPINPDMEVVSAVSTDVYKDEGSSSFSNKSKARRKVTPYTAPGSINPPTKTRPKILQSREPICSQQSTEEPASKNNYELLLKQQQLFLDWQHQESQAGDQEKGDSNGDLCRSQQGALSAPDSSRGMNVDYSSSEVGSALQTEYSPGSVAYKDHICQPGICGCPETSSHDGRRLSDYRVQDLKNECKKRQLPVSGAKPQLLERLRPFERTILCSSSEGGPSTPPTSPELLQQASHQMCDGIDTSPALQHDAQTSQMHPPVREQTRETIHDFLQQNATQQQHKLRQQQQQKQQQQQQQQQHQNQQVHHVNQQHQLQLQPQQPTQFVVQLHQPQQQFVKLVDRNGAVIGLTTMESLNSGVVSLAMPPQIHTSIVQSPSISSASVVPISTMCESKPTPVQNFSPIQHNQCLSVQSAPRSVSTSVVQQKPSSSMQPVDHPTFRFAQLGSGGQFTIVQSSEQSATTGDNNCQTTIQVAPIQTQAVARTTMPANSLRQQVSLQGGNMVTVSARAKMSPPTSLPVQTHVMQHAQQSIQNVQSEIVHYEESQDVHHGQNVYQATAAIAPPAQSQFVQVAFVDNDGTVRRACQSGSPVTGDAAASSPNMPPPSAYNPPPPHARNITIDPNDPGSLASTLQLHEEMLKYQQKRIEEMRTELHKSQQQLRTQQQLILVAKKQQAQLVGGDGGRQSRAEHWLSELDVRQLNRDHIQSFLDHKVQHQQLQQCVNEQNSLVQTEAKLQEELHIDQAVQDIVRLIKQDARTALLVVQLLRKYQLERQAELQKEQHARREEEPLQQVEQNRAEQARRAALCLQQNMQNVKQQNTQHHHQSDTNQQMFHETAQSGQHRHELDRSHSESPQVISVVVQKQDVQNQYACHGLQVPQQLQYEQRRASNPELSHFQMSRYQEKHSMPDVQIISDDDDHPSTPPNMKKRSMQKGNMDGAVDMEEIFKTVLEDASRALRGELPPPIVYSDGTETTAYGTPESANTPQYQPEGRESVALDVACNQQQVNQLTAETTVGQAENKQHGEHSFVLADSSHMINFDAHQMQQSPEEQQMVQQQHQQHVLMHAHNDMHMHHAYHHGHQSTDHQMDECSRETVVVLDSGRASGSGEEHTNDFFNKNQEFDDLMDVLRDDQDASMKTNSMLDFGLNYGQDELAQLIGDDWLDSAHKTLQQQGGAFFEEQDSSNGIDFLSDQPNSNNSTVENDQQTMDWLDMMLHSAPMDECLRTNNTYQARNQEMDATC